MLYRAANLDPRALGVNAQIEHAECIFQEQKIQGPKTKEQKEQRGEIPIKGMKRAKQQERVPTYGTVGVAPFTFQLASYCKSLD